MTTRFAALAAARVACSDRAAAFVESLRAAFATLIRSSSVSDLDPIRDGRHYDALKAQNDIPFYLSRAATPRGGVLEIGCGTGRVTIPLAAAGAEITGLDVSASMLEEAKRKAQERGEAVGWVEADASHFDLGRRFAAILMPFNTLQFFRDKPSLTQVFDRVKCHLEEDGRFILDVFNPQVSFLAADPVQRYERARYPDPYGRGEVVHELGNPER